MNWKNILAVIAAGLSGFMLGLSGKFIYESSTFRPYAWPQNKDPIIINCYGKDFNKYQMERAIEYWKIKGESIGAYIHNPGTVACKNKWLEGFIILKKSEDLRHDPVILANTRRYTSITTIRGAVIHYKPGTQNLNLINEHELGHALGFAHVDISGHVMHPLYHKMGRDYWVP